MKIGEYEFMRSNESILLVKDSGGECRVATYAEEMLVNYIEKMEAR